MHVYKILLNKKKCFPIVWLKLYFIPFLNLLTLQVKKIREDKEKIMTEIEKLASE